MKKLTFLLAFITVVQLNGQIPMDGLVAYYELDKNAIDSTDHLYDAEIIGTVIGHENRFGQEDKALFFDGGSNYIDLKDTSLLNLNEAISISLWIKPETVTTAGWICLVNKWEDVAGPGGKGYYLGINSDGSTLRWNTGSVNTDGDPITPGDWINIVATYDSDSMKIYRNNVLEVSIPALDTIQSTIIPFRLGFQSQIFAGFQYYHGVMDEVLIYDRALTSSEVDQIYTNMPTNTEDDEFANLAVYPNPFSEFITIKTNHPSITHYEIIDIQGRIVKKIMTLTNSQQISTRDLHKGTYFLNFYTNKGFAESRKIIKH